MKKTFFYVVVFLQMLFLLLIAGSKWYTLCFGRTVLLRTVPVDPRSLFRGDYVILSYEISRIDLEKIPSEDRAYRKNDLVYVRLRKGREFWYPVGISKSRVPLKRLDEVLIKGVVRGVSGKVLSIEYGIESFFVPEGEGREIERARDRLAVKVEIRVDGFGESAIRRIFVYGRSFDF
jgi:uncharacterized membrane-anchored protein